MADVQDWPKFPEFRVPSEETQGTNQSRYKKNPQCQVNKVLVTVPHLLLSTFIFILGPEPMETTAAGACSGGDGGNQGIKSKFCNITYNFLNNSNQFIMFHMILTIPSNFQYSSLQPYRPFLPWTTSPVYNKLQEAQLGQAQV